MSRVPRICVRGLPANGRVRLPDDEAAHLRVLRARPGDAVRVFDGAGREVDAAVVEVGNSGVLVELGADVPPRRPRRQVVLVTAIPRGERMEWLVEKAVEAGVREVVPLAADRSVRKEAGPNVRRRWARAALEAAKQCGRADVPEVSEPTTLEDAIVRTAGSPRAVATPGAVETVAEVLPADGSVAIFIGPEGGFDLRESALLDEAGATPFGLGPMILRVETAAVVAVHLAAS